MMGQAENFKGIHARKYSKDIVAVAGLVWLLTQGCANLTITYV
jgi:hypothetical protein